MDPLITSLISAATALITSIIVIIITQVLNRKKEEEIENKIINKKYLHPLRLYIEENHFRINEIYNRVISTNGSYEILSKIPAKEISVKKDQWFNGSGCYLISSCYLTACLFYQIERVKEDLSYLKLGKHKDTELINLMFKVSHAFLQNKGIFYATQPSIGIDLYNPEKERLLSYREFCQLLKVSKKRVWFDRLIQFYIDTGNKKNLQRVQDALIAMYNLSKYLDKVVQGGTSIPERYKSEDRLLVNINSSKY